MWAVFAVFQSMGLSFKGLYLLHIQAEEFSSVKEDV